MGAVDADFRVGAVVDLDDARGGSDLPGAEEGALDLEALGAGVVEAEGHFEPAATRVAA